MNDAQPVAKSATKYKLTISITYAHYRRHEGRIFRSFVWTDKADAEARQAALKKAAPPSGVTFEFLEFSEAVPLAGG